MENQLVRLAHLLSAALFIGSVIVIQILKMYCERKWQLGDGRRSLMVAVATLDRYLMPTSSAMLTASGLVLWWMNRTGAHDMWFIAAVVGWAFVMAVGIGYLGPTLQEICRAPDTETQSATYVSKNRRWKIINYFAVSATVIIFTYMVFKSHVT